MLTLVSQAGEVAAATVAEPQPVSPPPQLHPSPSVPSCLGGGGPALVLWVRFTPHYETLSIPPLEALAGSR